MDNLAREAKLARKAGMTYGKWKAMQKPAKPKKKQIPEGWRECIYCGKPFKPSHPSQKYCDIYCRNQAYKPKEKAIKREYMKEYRERMKEDG